MQARKVETIALNGFRPIEWGAACEACTPVFSGCSRLSDEHYHGIVEGPMAGLLPNTENSAPRNFSGA
jgi:hypothetical protein